MLKTIWRWIKRIFLWSFITSFIYLVLCKWMMPPITLTQLGSFISGDGLKKDYVSWNEISSNVKLAAMASEDQLFPDHHGFDWVAIEKSLKAIQTRKIKLPEQVRAQLVSKPQKIFFYGRVKVLCVMCAKCLKYISHS